MSCCVIITTKEQRLQACAVTRQSAWDLIYDNCAGGDVGGLQAELERLASLAGANPDNKVQAGNKIDKTNYRNYNIDPSSKYVMMKSH